MSNFPVREFHENSIIFEEGSFGSAAYILKKGLVEISTKIGGKKIVLTELTPVTIFGEMALLTTEQKRTATAQAIGYVQVIEIDKNNFDALMADSPAIITTVLYATTQRLVDTTAQLHRKKL
jgi:CRP/FNR family cyclic AMP-dependent transcriptional regulator